LGCLLANFEFVFLLDGRSGMPEFDTACDFESGDQPDKNRLAGHGIESDAGRRAPVAFA
jgi:hypothetical protein